MSLSTIDLADAVGPYPPGVGVARTATAFWMSGATAIPLYHMHPHVEEECVLPDDIQEQTRRVMRTFDEVLRFNGLGWRDVAKFAIFLTDLRDEEIVHEVIEEFVGADGWKPATTVVGINALSSPGARIEIEPVAAASGGDGDPVLPIAAPRGSDANPPAVLAPSGSGLVFLSDVRADAPLPQGMPNGIVEQTALAVDALEAALAARGLGVRNVAKVLASLVDLRELDAVRRVLDERFGDWTPAFTAVQVDNLPSPGARVQFDVIATA